LSDRFSPASDLSFRQRCAAGTASSNRPTFMSQRLVTCHLCGADIASSALSCPRCGGRTQRAIQKRDFERQREGQTRRAQRDRDVVVNTFALIALAVGSLSLLAYQLFFK
jgi:hypothetical protein